MTADDNNTRFVGAGEKMTAFLELVHTNREQPLPLSAPSAGADAE